MAIMTAKASASITFSDPVVTQVPEAITRPSSFRIITPTPHFPLTRRLTSEFTLTIFAAGFFHLTMFGAVIGRFGSGLERVSEWELYATVAPVSETLADEAF